MADATMHEAHGADCTCGCHDHEHDHGHERAHTREIECRWARVELEAHMHDQAATVSARIHACDGSNKTFSDLVCALHSIASAVEAAGGIVGHIKAYARDGERYSHASATDAQHAPACEGDARLALTPDSQSELVAIALPVGLDELEQMVMCAL